MLGTIFSADWRKERKADEEAANPKRDHDPSSDAAAFFATAINRTVGSNTANQHQETGERYVNTNVPVPLINRGSCPVPPTGIDIYAASTHRIISLSSNFRHPGTTAYTTATATATATGSSASLGIASLSINEPNSVPTLNSLTLGEVVMENYALTFGGVTYGLGRGMPIERMIELIEEEWTFNEALLRLLGHGDNKSN